MVPKKNVCGELYCGIEKVTRIKKGIQIDFKEEIRGKSQPGCGLNFKSLSSKKSTITIKKEGK